MSPSKTESKNRYPNAKKVISEILNATRGERCIFRGESIIYPGPISSSLYRQLKREKVTAKNIQGLLKERQKELIERLRSRTTRIGGDLEKLMASQHYGAKTNLLDFTENVFVALFFACWRDENEDGRVVIKQRRIFYEPATEKDMLPDEKIAIIVLPERYIRAADQNTVLLHAPQGFLSFTEEEIVLIRKEWKKEIRELLERVYNISYETIFGDMQGVIERQSHEDKERVLEKTQPITTLQGFNKPRKSRDIPIMESYMKLLNPRKSARHGNFINHQADLLIEILTNSLKHNPRDARAYYNRASVYLSKPVPDYTQAISDYDLAILLNPSFTEAYNNRGNVHAIKPSPDYDQAILDYTQAMELNPDLAEAYNNRGNAYTAKTPPDYYQAISDYTRAIELNPKNREAYHNRGLVYANKKPDPDYDKAISDYTSALKLDPGSVLTYASRGNAYRRVSPPEYEKALRDYDQAIKLNPNYVEVYNHRGNLYSTKPDPDHTKAIEDYSKALSIDPSYSKAYHNRGVANYVHPQSDYAQALSDFNQAISLDPDFVPTYILRAAVYAALGDVSKAKDSYNTALKMDQTIAGYPMSPELLKLLAPNSQDNQLSEN